ncbi:MAG: hypothetical protein OEZ05_17090, partial [Nitrospirota bacterium]|nr:hypothetical protein [Nitrospirota bacterium]
MTFLNLLSTKSASQQLILTIGLIFFSTLAAFPPVTLAKPYFEDGLLGLTQEELHAQLGTPMAVRSRKAA